MGLVGPLFYAPISVNIFTVLSLSNNILGLYIYKIKKVVGRGCGVILLTLLKFLNAVSSPSLL